MKLFVDYNSTLRMFIRFDAFNCGKLSTIHAVLFVLYVNNCMAAIELSKFTNSSYRELNCWITVSRKFAF